MSKDTTRPFGVNLSGYIASEKGVGEAVRSDIRCLEAATLPYVVNNLVDEGSANKDTTFKRFCDDNPYGINVIHVNADQVPTFERQKGEAYFEGRYNIGYWAWELSSFPEEWHSSFKHFDEVWVPSNFTLDAVSRAAPIPTLRVPHSIPNSLTIKGWGRPHFNLPEGKYIFLFIFDFHSFMDRKNPLGLIKAFKTAFSGNDDAWLVLKCSHSQSCHAEVRAVREASKGANIRIVDSVMSREEINTLLHLSDCYISLHRSEGFGLTMAEAMSMAKPVIATGYSGNMDFMTFTNSFPVKYNLIEIEQDRGPYKKGYVWADPDLDHAAQLMRLVYENKEVADGVGGRARQDIHRTLHPAVVGELIKERLTRANEFQKRAVQVAACSCGQALARSDRIEYQRSIRHIRKTVSSMLPPDARVIVVSKGDDALMKLGGRKGLHFPQTEDGLYAGYHPADSSSAIGHLEALRARGADFLLFPNTAFWWLDYYEEFIGHLDYCYQCIRADEHCVIYRLAPRGADAQSEQLKQMSARIDHLLQVVHHTRESAAAARIEQRVSALAERARAHNSEIERVAKSVELGLAELAESIQAQNVRVDRIEQTAELHDTKIGQLTEEYAMSVEQTAKRVEFQLADLASLIQAQGARADQLSQAITSIAARFAARPFIARNIFNTDGDLDKPMGYGLDAADSATSFTTPIGFADLFRGPEDFVLERQRVYLPFFEGRKQVVDLGCGRGEFLRLLAEGGIPAAGVELDGALVRRLTAEGLQVVESDAIEYLRGLPEGSLDAIFSAQFIEHISPEQLSELLALSKRRLREGGIFIAETVNPESFEALKAFHVDLTHRRPIYPQVLLYLCREARFPTARIFYPLGGGFTQHSYEAAGEYAVIALA